MEDKIRVLLTEEEVNSRISLESSYGTARERRDELGR